MNREIKFRAWDDRKKEWLLGYGFKSLGGFSLYGETMLMGEWASTLDHFIFERGEQKAADLKVMQFIGLKDKNGKEIYEGDIIELTDGNYQKRVFTVEYSERRAMFVERTTKRNRSTYPLPNIVPSFWEVIGNIYENPELLP